jgi:transposase
VGISIKLYKNINGINEEIKCIIIKKPTYKWFAFFQADENYHQPPKTNKVICIDLEIYDYAVDLNGNNFLKIQNSF